jgi:hypothetical protein
MATMHMINCSRENGGEDLLGKYGSPGVMLMWAETKVMPLEIEKMGPKVRARVN